MEGTVALLAIGTEHIDRLVGKLDAEPSGVLLDIVIARHLVPHVEQVLLIVVAHLDVARAHARRTHDDVETMSLGLVRNLEIELVEIADQSLLREVLYVRLATHLVAVRVDGLVARSLETLGRDIGIVGPAWVEVQTEDIAPRTLGSVGDCCEKTVEIVDTFINILITVLIDIDPMTIGETVAAEVWTRRIHHTM